MCRLGHCATSKVLSAAEATNTQIVRATKADVGSPVTPSKETKCATILAPKALCCMRLGQLLPQRGEPYEAG